MKFIVKLVETERREPLRKMTRCTNSIARQRGERDRCRQIGMMREKRDRWKDVDRWRQQVREDIRAVGLEPESTQQADSYICRLY